MGFPWVDLNGPGEVLVWGTMECGHTIGYCRVSRRILDGEMFCPLCRGWRPLVRRGWAGTGWIAVSLR